MCPTSLRAQVPEKGLIDVAVTTKQGAIVSGLQDWTSDPTNAIEQFFGLSFQGATLLYDSIYKGTEKVLSGDHLRNILIVITDGQDSFAKSRDLERVFEIITTELHSQYRIAITRTVKESG